MTVLVVGDVVTDILASHAGALAVGSDTDARIRIRGGGSAANTAAWLAVTGTATTLLGVVGDDEAGGARLAELRAAGVVTAVRRAAGAVTGSVVVLSTGTERTMLCDRGANTLLTTDDVVAALPTLGQPHVHLSGYTLFDPRTAPAGRLALARAGTTSVDAASAAPLAPLTATFLDSVRDVDLLFANVDEARVLTGRADAPELMATALLAHARAAVVKCGPDGAVWAGRDTPGPVAVPAIRVREPVDPTGAGDAFAAGFLASWLRGGDPATALAAGARLGARAVGRLGARP